MVERADNKYAHLLQPIRDLAANWDVNVAEELEDYLDDLESIHFSLEDEGSPTGLNFAEAALLIQGSASVYSKKVEYLHSLVYAAIEAIAHKRFAKKTTADAGAGVAEDDADNDTEVHFLTLDDISEGGSDIDMEDGEALPPPTTSRSPICLSVLGNCPGPISTSKFKAFVSKTGAVILDPSDVDPPAIPEGRDERAQCPADAGSDGEGRCFSPGRADDVVDHPMSCAPSPAHLAASTQDEYVHGRDGNTGSASPLGEADGDGGDVFDDPYEPLNPHEPGTLAVAPARLRMPKRREPNLRMRRKGPVSSKPLLVAPLDATVFPEFAEYLKERRKASAVKQRSQARTAEDDPADTVLGDLDAAATGGFARIDDDDANFADDHYYEGGEEPIDPIVGADAEALAVEAQNSAAIPPFQRQQPLELSFQATVLEERVRVWQQSIEPHLREQDARPAFDIKEYGNRILDTLSARAKRGDLASFSIITDKADAWEVARLFSSMLQLINTGSIRIL